VGHPAPEHFCGVECYCFAHFVSGLFLSTLTEIPGMQLESAVTISAAASCLQRMQHPHGRSAAVDEVLDLGNSEVKGGAIPWSWRASEQPFAEQEAVGVSSSSSCDCYGSIRRRLRFSRDTGASEISEVKSF
jgi:hypothetical protein